MTKPLISIIVPIYNSSLFLKKCLDSLINQTIEEIEIILIDDGSIDDSCTICKEYEKKDNRIKYYYQDNAGPGKARNHGLEVASAEWITFVDSDDWIEPFYCQRLISNVNNEVDMVVGRTVSVKNDEICDDHFNYNGTIVFSSFAEKDILIKSIISDDPSDRKIPHLATCSAKLFRRQLITKYNLKHNELLIYYEDAFFNISFIEKSNKVLVINDILYFYRENANSSTNCFSEKTINGYENACLELKNVASNSRLLDASYINKFNIKNLFTILRINLKPNNSFASKRFFVKKLCCDTFFSREIKSIRIKDTTIKHRKLYLLLLKAHLFTFFCFVYR